MYAAVGMTPKHAVVQPLEDALRKGHRGHPTHGHSFDPMSGGQYAARDDRGGVSCSRGFQHQVDDVGASPPEGKSFQVEVPLCRIRWHASHGLAWL